MMGMCWNIKEDHVTPTLYISRFEKKRGQRLGIPLYLDTDLSLQHVTRLVLVLSRVTPQLYDPYAHIGILKAQGKMVLSRSCQIASIHQMDTPLAELDEAFAKQALSWLREVEKIKELNPIKRALIQGEEILIGLTSHVDGGVAGYGAVVYVTVKTALDNLKLTNIVFLYKSRVSRRNVVLQECLSKCLGIQTMLLGALPLSERWELQDMSLIFVIATDSV